MTLNKISINDTTTVNTGVVYDIPKATGQSYDSLTAALGTDGNNVPLEIREGGMSIRFVQTSDNKYVQYRLMTTYFSTLENYWQINEDAINKLPPMGETVIIKDSDTNLLLNTIFTYYKYLDKQKEAHNKWIKEILK